MSNLTPASSTNSLLAPKKPYPQNFSISSPIIRYMIKNPKSGKFWKKLIQTCKYFYSKSSILPIDRVLTDYFGSKYYIDGKEYHQFSFVPKLWIYRLFSDNSPHLEEPLIPKIYKFELQSLHLGRKNFSWNDYKKLTSSGTIKELEFYRVFIIDVDDNAIVPFDINNDDNTMVPFDKLIENLDNLESLKFNGYKEYCQALFNKNSATKMIEHLMSFKNMKSLYFKTYAYSCIDFSFFVDFLMNNETIEVAFDYLNCLPDDVRETMEIIYKETLENPRLKVPRFYGLD